MPLNTIDITRTQDIQLPDESDRREYRAKIQIDDIVGARNIVDSNLDLYSKVLTPGLVNELSDGITAMQDKYDEDFTQHMAALVEEWNTYVSDFKMVEWNALAEYQERNFVLYDGEVYLCVGETSGILPPDDANWVLVGLRGEDGAMGLGVAYKGAWSPATPYAKLDAVVVQNKIYVAKANNTNSDPRANPNDWLMAMDGDDNVAITVSEEEPPGIYDGGFWWSIMPELTTYGELSNYTHEFLSGYTHEEIRLGTFL